MLTPIDLFSFHSFQCSKNACQRVTYLLNLNQDSYSLLLKIKITFTPIVDKALYKKGERIIIFQHHLLEEELHTCPPRTNSSTMKVAIVFSFAFVVTDAKRLLPYLTAETALNASKATLPVGEVSENSAPFDMSAGYTFRKITDRVTLNTIEALPEGFNSFDMALRMPLQRIINLDCIRMQNSSSSFRWKQQLVEYSDTIQKSILILARSNSSLQDNLTLLQNNLPIPRNIDPGTFNVTNDNFIAIDPATFTPFNTVLFAEELSGQ